MKSGLSFFIIMNAKECSGRGRGRGGRGYGRTIWVAAVMALLVTLSTTTTTTTTTINKCHAFTPVVVTNMKNDINRGGGTRRRYINSSSSNGNKLSSSSNFCPPATQLSALPPLLTSSLPLTPSLLTDFTVHTAAIVATTNHLVIADADVAAAAAAEVSKAAMSGSGSSGGGSEAGAGAALSVRDTWIIFIAGVAPFAVATVEFWRRVRVGESFGTGTDSVVFSVGEDDVSPLNSRGRRTLGTGALITAIILFVVSFGTLGIVLYSVITSEPPPPTPPPSL